MMKYTTVLIFLIFISCGNKDSKVLKSENNGKNITSESKRKPLPFFEFDEVVYYHVDDKLDKEWGNLRRNKNRTNEESRFLDIFFRNHPKSLNDKQFISDLEKFYPNKKEIESNKFKEINNIFCEKFYGDYSLAGCIAIYRDILIFKKNKTVVGISKICFQCYLHQTIGTKRNTDQLGQNGDYEKLENILKSL
jgi:hypothetical protein